MKKGRADLELRTLKYFVTVAEEGNFSTAARKLCITQPTLSRQIQDLEEGLGAKLLIRTGRGATLTGEGIYFLKKAREILALARTAKEDLARGDTEITGETCLACGETQAMRHVAKAIKKMRAQYQGISCRILSGNAENARHWLEAGLAGFGLFVLPANLDGLDFARLPWQDVWGVLMRKDDPLAASPRITPRQLEGLNLICSSQALAANELAGWFGASVARIRIAATYNLLFNASMLVQAGVGVALALDGIINTGPDSPFQFRELDPPVRVDLALVWKSGAAFSRPDQIFRKFFDSEAFERS